MFVVLPQSCFAREESTFVVLVCVVSCCVVSCCVVSCCVVCAGGKVRSKSKDRSAVDTARCIDYLPCCIMSGLKGSGPPYPITPPYL